MKEREMRQLAVADYARQLFDRFGRRASAIAAKRSQEFELKGEQEKVHDWRRIQLALAEIRGPAES